MTGRLLIRTEASNAVGMGHFMRCFAVAEAARERKIVTHVLIDHISDAIRRRCVHIAARIDAMPTFGDDIEQLKAFLLPDDWLLIDSYKATDAYVAALHKVARVAVIDDLNALERYDCDLIINAAMSAPREAYAAKSGARLLLGPDYALIRREFRKPGLARYAGSAVGIMFGGSDPRRLTGGCAAMLRDAMPESRLVIVAGPAHIHTDELHAMAAGDPLIELHVDPPSVAGVLAGCDLVLTAAGGSVGEMAAMGLAALVLVLYDNQQAALEQCPFPVIDARVDLPADLGLRAKALIEDPVQLKAIAMTAHRIVDGKGAKRIVEAMFHA
jgi:UDP-2,4-diacetamido-2,4,6-trideoxy-beta-L-altropyranose hydrolase